MSQDEIAVMDGGKCIMQLRGVRPFFSDKFDITKHKRYKELSDYDKKNAFDMEQYVKHLHHLKVTEKTKVDEAFECGEISPDTTEQEHLDTMSRGTGVLRIESNAPYFLQKINFRKERGN